MDGATKIAIRLLQSRDIIHMTHLASLRYPEHMALDEYYKDITEIADRFIETTQGIKGALEDLKSPGLGKVENPVEYLVMIDKFIEANKSGLRSFQVAILDDAQELIYSTVYKLRFLH